MKRLEDWKAQKAKNAIFQSLWNYLNRVESMFYFVADSPSGDLHLHLQAGEAHSKLFPFVAIGDDHACEQINRLLKINGGTTGVSNNAR